MQVDETLHAVRAQLEGGGATSADTAASPSCAADMYAEAMLTILDQVATLRTIGSQTHPAIHQLILSHEDQLQASDGGWGTRAGV
jgi:hypothetical protein